MKNILITKSIAYGAKIGGGVIASQAELDLLDAGAIVVLRSDTGALVDQTATAGDLNDCPEVVIAVGAANGTPVRTAVVNRREVQWIEKKAYVAPVKHTQFVGNNGTTGALNLPTAATGNILTIKIADISDGTQPPKKRETISYTYTASDTNLTAITALIAKINANSAIATSVVVGAQVGFSVVSKVNQQTLEISLDDSLVNATRTNDGTNNSVRPIYGHGIPFQIAALELYNDIEAGQSNRLSEPDSWFSRVKLTDTAATYDTYAIEIQRVTRGQRADQASGRNDLIIAMPNAGTGQANFETVLGVLFGAQYTIGSAGGSEAGT